MVVDAEKIPISELVRMARYMLGMNQIQFGEYLDVSKNTIINWENGHTTPQWRYLQVIFKILSR